MGRAIKHELTPRDITVLDYISRHPGSYVAQISDMLMMTDQTVGISVARLESRGKIKAIRNPAQWGSPRMCFTIEDVEAALKAMDKVYK